MLASRWLRILAIGILISVLFFRFIEPTKAEGPSGGGGAQVQDQLEVARSELAASGFTLDTAPSAPSELPVTGLSQAAAPSLGTAVGIDQWEVAANELAASGVQVQVGTLETASPASLPQTGAADQVPPFLGPQAPAAPNTGPDPVMGAIMGGASSAPSGLPATGAELGTYQDLVDLYQNLFVGPGPAPALPSTGVPNGADLKYTEQYRALYGNK